MKLFVLQENLNKGLTAVCRLVTGKAQLPILNNVLLATDNGRLKLSATNLEMGINFWLGARVDKEGAITVPARMLGEFIASLPGEKVELTLSEGMLKVICGGVEATFNSIAAGEFPTIPVLAGEPTFLLPSDVFRRAVSCTAFAAAADEGRQVLTGVKWIFRGDEFTMAATDGYRLSVKKFRLGKKKKDEEGELLIPARALLEMVKILGEDRQRKPDPKEKEEVRVRVTPEANQAIFEVNDTGLVTRLLEGQFPNFEKIIPKDSTTKAVLDTVDFLKAIRVAAIFARDSANLVKLKIEKDTLRVSANAPQVGGNVSTIEAKTDGEECEIAFNCRYLLDLLSGATSERVSMETSGPLRPGVFRFVGDDSFLHVIMPVRVQ